jgi:hypothetical protein
MTFLAASRRVNRVLRDCEARLTELNLSVPGDIADLTRYLSRRTGRLIHLMPMEFRTPPLSGMWLALPAVDLVIYESDTTRTHQEHIIAHELAHIICGHNGRVPLDEDTARRLFPSLNPALVRDMLNRTEYADDHEMEAEVMASLILGQAQVPEARDAANPPPGTETALGRLERSFTLASSDGR